MSEPLVSAGAVAERARIAALREKYKEIVKWGHELRSFDYYIDNQVLHAEADGAPVNATYKGQDGTWRTR